MNRAAIDRARIRRHNLPAELTSFVGRASQIAELKKVVLANRLVTLSGAGGCGKTRLASRVALELLSDYPDGVWLVELAALSEPDRVAERVAAAIGVTEEPGRPMKETLVHFLLAKRLLLVVDNCEHLVAGCAQLVEDVLRIAGDVQVLATSRESLHVPGEVVWRVPPLSMPALGARPSLELLAQFEAVRLFVERARSRDSRFALTSDNASAIVDICHRLDGIPLAIELAASLASALRLDDLAERLGHALQLLVNGRQTLPRQQTLRATLDWSYALLSPREQTVLGRIAVFAGGFDLAAAEHVASGGGIASAAIPALLAALADKSFIVVLPSAPGRYRLLETVRLYAAERLQETGEADQLREKHAHHFRDLAETAETKLRGGGREPWLERLAADEDNLRSALTWSWRTLENGTRTSPVPDETGLRLAGALFWYWYVRGAMNEGSAWLLRATAHLDQASAAVRAKVHFGAGGLAWLQGQYPEARQWFSAAAQEQLALGDKPGRALTLAMLTTVLEGQGEPERADACLAKSTILFRNGADGWGLAVAAQVAGIQFSVQSRRSSARSGQRSGRRIRLLTRDRSSSPAPTCRTILLPLHGPTGSPRGWMTSSPSPSRCNSPKTHGRVGHPAPTRSHPGAQPDRRLNESGQVRARATSPDLIPNNL